MARLSTATSGTRLRPHPRRRSLRRWLASFAWAAAVNYSLMAGTDPPFADHPRTPVASYRREHLIDDTWAIGEYVGGAIPRIIVYANPETADEVGHERCTISLN